MNLVYGNKDLSWLKRNPHTPYFRWDYPDGDSPPPEIPERKVLADFSSGNIAPLTLWGVDSLIVTSLNPPPGGGNSIMGNIAQAFAEPDPITGKSRNGSPVNLDIYALTSGANRAWPGVFMQYWMRFDDADNSGTSEQGAKIVSAPKLGYLSCTKTTFETGSAIFPTLAPTEGIRSYSRNSNSDGGDPTPDWPSSAVQTRCPGLNYAYDGNWYLVQIYVDQVNNTIQIWINNILATGFTHYTDGALPVSEIFTFDHMRFFHGNNNVFNQSVNRSGEKGRFQIAKIEIWNGNPKGIVDGYI